MVLGDAQHRSAGGNDLTRLSQGMVEIEEGDARRVIALRTTDAQATLVDLLGEELGTLDAELGKLAAYVGDRTEIGAVDVDQMTGFHRQELVFRVMDAVYDGDPAAALAAARAGSVGPGDVDGSVGAGPGSRRAELGGAPDVGASPGA